MLDCVPFHINFNLIFILEHAMSSKKLSLNHNFCEILQLQVDFGASTICDI